jgi:hypothetical protein
MRSTFLLPLFLLLSCETDVIEPKAVGGDPFSLRHGETAVVHPSGALIRFDELLGDSRCPLYLECFWEGRADLKMWFRTPAADEISLQLSIYGYRSPAFCRYPRVSDHAPAARSLPAVAERCRSRRVCRTSEGHDPLTKVSLGQVIFHHLKLVS